MTRTKRLNKKQLAAIDDLFSGQFDEQAVLEKHKISRNVYNKWLGDEIFTDEFNRRIAWLNLQSEALIARYASLAAAKLVQLTESESQETARKACLDIISLPREEVNRGRQPEASEGAKMPAGEQLSAEVASRLLAALAGQKEGSS